MVPRLLEDKIAIVTGAAHGIGRGHALELARHGAAVMVADLGTSVRGEGRGADAQEVADLIVKRGGTALADFTDVGDEEQCAALVDRAVAKFGRLDILVNNAGIVRDKVIWNMSAEDFDAESRGTTLLLAEERAKGVLDIADHVILLELGRILWAGPRPGLQEEQLAAIYLGSAQQAVAATVTESGRQSPRAL